MVLQVNNTAITQKTKTYITYIPNTMDQKPPE